jgi:hypothetical protein
MPSPVRDGGSSKNGQPRRFLVLKRLVRRFLAGLGIGMLVVIRGDRGSDD